MQRQAKKGGFCHSTPKKAVALEFESDVKKKVIDSNQFTHKKCIVILSYHSMNGGREIGSNTLYNSSFIHFNGLERERENGEE